MSQALTVELDYKPQLKQQLLHTTAARLVFYGGSLGGGKSHSLRWDAISWCLQVPGIQVFLFRRTLKELEKTHIRKLRTDVPSILGSYNETKKIFDFFNGSSIAFCYCEKEYDVHTYQSEEMHVLLIDEAGHLTEYQLNYLMTRNRLGGFAEKVPEKLRHLLPRAAFGSNPGGPGHNFLKETFIDPAPPMTLFHSKRFKDKRNPDKPGRLSIYIPARMDDNSYLDDDYAENLEGLAPELLKALRDGDWNAIVGQALTIDEAKHRVRSFRPPRHWTHFMAIDWGTGKPFSVGWYCVSEGAFLDAKDGWPEKWLPPGSVIRYAEWYGWNGRANTGSRMDSRQVARGIVQREAERGDPPMDYRIADSGMWAKHDGPSPAENMFDEDPRLTLRPSQKDRERNYNEILARLSGNADLKGAEEHPMFFCTTDCIHFWRTVPVLTLDTLDPNKGPDSKLEDHVYDELAYALRSRPFMTTEEDREEEDFRRHMRKHGRKSEGRYAT